jgi:hypothetical protein
MSKFANRRSDQSLPRTPVRTTGQAETNPQGGLGLARDVQSELYLLAIANLVGESTFYETASNRDNRFVQLVHQAVALDPGWVARLIRHLRRDLGMRSVAVVAAAQYALAVRSLSSAERVSAPAVREVVDSALDRADEPAEFLAYWRIASGGRSVPRGVQNGVADAVSRLYTERSALKYDGTRNSWRFGHVIDVVHPTPRGLWQSQLFAHLLDQAHHPTSLRAEPGELLPVLAARARIAAMGPEARQYLLSNPEALGEAGMTWEALSGMGPMDGPAWDAMIPQMGVFALTRNLRNFDQSGISADSVRLVQETLTDPQAISRSRMFPFRFLAAYRAVTSDRWLHALSQALDLSLNNVPRLGGKTLILVDRSGSMFWSNAAKSDLTLADQAAVFGTAIALRAENPTLVQFGTDSRTISAPPGSSVLRLLSGFQDLGGTRTEQAILKWYSGHDRVMIITDEQHAGDNDPLRSIPEHVPVYTWNLGGYRLAHSGAARNRHSFGGLTDQAFRMVPLLEAGKSASWPF